MKKEHEKYKIDFMKAFVAGNTDEMAEIFQAKMDALSDAFFHAQSVEDRNQMLIIFDFDYSVGWEKGHDDGYYEAYEYVENIRKCM